MRGVASGAGVGSAGKRLPIWHHTKARILGSSTPLFGASWAFTILFGLVLAFTFIGIIRFLKPPMWLGPRMPTAFLLAHVPVIFVIGFSFAAFIVSEASASSSLSQVMQLLGLQGAVRSFRRT
ncbi:MAG: hypothetical protein V3U33_08770 [candidate division NC10 bacterium]